MSDLGSWTRFMYHNNMKDTFAYPMIKLIQNTLDKNRAWLRIQEKHK